MMKWETSSCDAGADHSLVRLQAEREGLAAFPLWRTLGELRSEGPRDPRIFSEGAASNGVICCIGSMTRRSSNSLRASRASVIWSASRYPLAGWVMDQHSLIVTTV